MTEWIKVVTQPMGLVGFALFLVFGYLAKVTRHDERRWLSPAAVGLALIALVGGLLIAYKQIPQPPQPTPTVQTTQPAQQQTNSNLTQKSSGQGSPNVQGVQGDVTITIDQSSGKTKTDTKKSAEKKPQETQ